MPQKDYRAYAQSPQGRAARARAHQRYVEKRRALRQSEHPSLNPQPLAAAVNTWSRLQ